MWKWKASAIRLKPIINKTKAEHHDGGMPVHKFGQEFAGGNHDNHCDDDRAHRHDDVIDHRHGGDDRIDGKHGIQYQDLRDHAPKRRVFLVVGNGKRLCPSRRSCSSVVAL